MCNTTFENEMDIQEFHTIDFIGGFSSVFGDENHIECHICQGCLLHMIGDYYRIIN